MLIQAVNSINNKGCLSNNNLNNVQMIKQANNADKVTFGYSSAYRDVFTRALSHTLTNGRHADEIFDMLRRAAISEGSVKNSRLMEVLNSGHSLRDLLFDFKMAVKGSNYSYHEKIVITPSGKPIIEASDTSIKFPDPIYGDFTGPIEFGIDSKYDVVVERPFDKVKFYQNNQLRERTKYTSDYSSSDTKYYNKDGSERSVRNFFSGLGL